MYVTTIEWMDDKKTTELRGYLSREFREGCIEFIWSDNTITIPLNNVRLLDQTEEGV